MKLSFPSPTSICQILISPPLAFGSVVQQENEKSISYKIAIKPRKQLPSQYLIFKKKSKESSVQSTLSFKTSTPIIMRLAPGRYRTSAYRISSPNFHRINTKQPR